MIGCLEPSVNSYRYTLRLTPQKSEELTYGVAEDRNTSVYQWRTERGGGGLNSPHPKIPKALQNRAKLNQTVKTVKNC